MSAYEWLLTFHVTGAFLLIGGAVAAAILNVLALRRERPSEIALILGLVRLVVPLIAIGALLALVFGLWLVHHVRFSYGEFWIWAAIALWVLGNYLGSVGGRRQAKARKLALDLAARGDQPSEELHTLLRDRPGNLMSWGSGVAILLILVLMIWKPGH